MMKQRLILLLIIFSLKCYSQTNGDAIIGNWLKTPKEDLIINVYKEGDHYNGKIAWARDNEKKKKIGFIILENLKYSTTKKMWRNGSIHDPSSGKTYDAEARFKPDGTLEVHAYLGLRFLGAKKYFKRVK